MTAQIQLVELGRTSIPLPGQNANRLETAPQSRSEISASTVEARISAIPFEEMDVVFDGSEGVLFAYFHFLGRPSFTPAILRDIGRVQDMVRTLFAAGAGTAPIKYIAWDSRMAGVWNLGGDLDLFATLIRRQDRDSLMRYARAVVEEGYSNATNLNLPIITVSLVRGDALGGGFEAALSSNLIVAERSAKFGLPEILFNLFPGMGAYSYLVRRIAPAQAERMITSGRLYTAEELYEMGVVDVLADDGHGTEALYEFIGRSGRRHPAHRAIFRARDRVNPLKIDELMDIAVTWVDTALGLTEPDLRKMARLVAAQDRRRERPAAE
ncbi:MAG TPA: crotonase/enoyl-CoA hydratase family protein [Stellaceae bacterium]|jgi:DSF synthase|nr:crotonase/enoyl-CoA hydratase family protein [Stellaceae bacterium]